MQCQWKQYMKQPSSHTRVTSSKSLLYIRLEAPKLIWALRALGSRDPQNRTRIWTQMSIFTILLTFTTRILSKKFAITWISGKGWYSDVKGGITAPNRKCQSQFNIGLNWNPRRKSILSMSSCGKSNSQPTVFSGQEKPRGTTRTRQLRLHRKR